MALRLQKPKDKRESENTITLINIVFLMLIFFLVAGSLTPPLDGSITMIETQDAEPAPPPDALSVTAEGAVRYRGEETSIAAYLAARERESSDEQAEAIRLVVDRELPAGDLVIMTGELRAAGIETVTVVTERSIAAASGDSE